MKSVHHKRFRRRLIPKSDLRGKLAEGDLTSFSDYLNQPHPAFYSASGSKNQSILEEPPEYREILGEYLETDPEIRDVAFSHQSILSTKELLGRGVCTQIIDGRHKQEGYEQKEGHIYHRPVLW